LVVQDSPLVTAATKERVRVVIAQLGYRPHAAAAALRRARSQTLAYVTTEVPQPALDVFRAVLVSALAARAQAAGQYLLLDPFVDEQRCLDLLDSGRIDGALLDYMVSDAVVRVLVERHAPVVLVGRDAGDLPIGWVKADEEEGAYQATRHLLNLGHRRVAVLAARRQGPNAIAEQRLAGHRRALTEAGIALTSDKVLYGDWSYESGRAQGRQLLALRTRPTAAFVLSELMAVALIQEANKQGLRVPHDLAVVTTENSPWVEYVRPRLSAVHVPMDEVGARATEMLLALLAESGRIPEGVVVPTRFVVRDSSDPSATERATSAADEEPWLAPRPTQ
jgi:DNA-binding LacI/PurR family transcriptional regulator